MNWHSLEVMMFLIALMVCGTIFFGGEFYESEFARRSCVAVLAIAFLVLAAGFFTALV